MNRTARLPHLLCVAVISLSLAGCGTESPPDQTTGDPVSSSPTSTGEESGISPGSTPPPATASPTLPEDPSLPSGTKGAVTLTGIVSVDTETRCTTLTTQDPRRVFVLVGDVSELEDGARVRVTGIQGDQAATCQSGPVFTVRSVTPTG